MFDVFGFYKFKKLTSLKKNKVLLQKVPIFMSMNESEINIISENCKRVHYNSNDVIIKQDVIIKIEIKSNLV